MRFSVIDAARAWRLALAALALLSRESAVLFPLALLLHEVLLARRRIWEALKRTAPFVAITLAYLLVRLAVLGTPPLTRLGPGTILDAAVVIVKRYVKIFFWPDAPVTQYSLPPAGLPRGEILTAYAVIAVLLALGVWLWRERKAACFWHLWFFLWFALNLNVGAIGEYLLAEKELYLGGLGFCVLMATGADRLGTRWAWAPLLALATLHGWTTFERSRYWRDGLTHLEKATEFAPDFYLFQYDLGNEYARRDRCGEAVAAYRKALRQKPDLSLAENNMANCLLRLGEYDAALTAWRRALEADPQNPSPYFNMGLGWERKGDLPAAMIWFRTYLRLVPAPSEAALAHIASVERQLAERAERPAPAH